jgi:hypothetical protein
MNYSSTLKRTSARIIIMMIAVSLFIPSWPIMVRFIAGNVGSENPILILL